MTGSGSAREDEQRGRLVSIEPVNVNAHFDSQRNCL